MRGAKNCPQCGGPGRKSSGRVMLLSTHRTYGYGERAYVCRRCGERFTIFYAIPPKSGVLAPKKDAPDRLLRPGWLESIRGHACHFVAGADLNASTD